MDISRNLCDRCPQQAVVRATYPSGKSLYACGHHAREWWPVDGDYDGITFEYAPVTIGGA